MTGNVADKYSRSGNYDAECEYLEWSNFTGGCASWVYYSVVKFFPLVMKQWLPHLPPYQIRDTSIRSVTAHKKKESTAKERMEKYRNKRKSEESDDDTISFNIVSKVYFRDDMFNVIFESKQ